MAPASRQPWMKFYPADWRADPALRSCSLAARGLWLEMIALMHEAEPYGHLKVKQQVILPDKLARLVGTDLYEVEQLLKELFDAGVYSLENGVIYSRRMVRDKERSERKQEDGRKGGNPQLSPGVNQEVNQEVNQDDKPSRARVPEARSQKPEAIFQKPESQEPKTFCAPTRASHTNGSADFDVWWKAYPCKKGKGQARKAYLKALARASPDELLVGVERYRRDKPDWTQWAHPATWLNGDRWLDEPAEPSMPEKTKHTELLERLWKDGNGRPDGAGDWDVGAPPQLHGPSGDCGELDAIDDRGVNGVGLGEADPPWRD